MNLEQGKVSSTFFKIFIPTLIGMLFSSLFIVIDGVMVSHGVGPEAFASINIVAPLYTIMTGLGLMFATGGSVLASAAMGQKQFRRARIFSTEAIYGSLILTAIFSIVIILFVNTTIKLLGTPIEFTPLVKEYLYTIVSFFPFNVFLIVAMFVIRLDGAPNYAASGQIVAGTLNIILDYIFIFTFEWGLFGAAIATGISQVVGSAILLYYLLFKAKTLRLKIIRAKARAIIFSITKITKRIIVLGFSPLLGEFAISAMILVGNHAFAKQYGSDGIIAFSVVGYLIPILFLVYMAVTASAQPIVSYCHSLGNAKRVKKVTSLALLTTGVFGLLTSILAFVFNEQVVSIFLKSGTQAYDIAVNGLPIIMVGNVFLGLNLVIIGYNQSIGRAVRASLLTITRGIFLMAISYVIMPIIIPSIGVWIATPIAEFTTLFIIIIIYRRYIRDVILGMS